MSIKHAQDLEGALGDRVIDRKASWALTRPELFSKADMVRLKEVAKDINKPEGYLGAINTPTTLKSLEVKNLNSKQQDFMIQIISFLKQSKEVQEQKPFQYLIQSLAGCGKTTLLKTVMMHFNNHMVKYRAAAHTGTAANAICGQTLSSLFGVKDVSYSVEAFLEDPDIENRQRELFDGVQFLIVDEIYNVGAKYLHFVDHSLRRMFKENRPWGGLSVIFLGDYNQLIPVGDFSLMHDLADLKEHDVILAIKGIEAFRAIKNVHFLTENVRALKDIRYARLLERFQRRKLNSEDIEMLEKSKRMRVAYEMEDFPASQPLLPSNDDDDSAAAAAAADPAVIFTFEKERQDDDDDDEKKERTDKDKDVLQQETKSADTAAAAAAASSAADDLVVAKKSKPNIVIDKVTAAADRVAEAEVDYDKLLSELDD